MLTSHDTVFLNSNTNTAEGQDKDRQSGDRPATKQVYRETAAFRSNRFAAQSDDRDNDLNALVPLTIQCKRYVKEEIHAIAKERSRKEKDKVSDSAVGADFLEWIVHHRENLRRGSYAEATLTKLFDRMYTEFSNRFLGLIAAIRTTSIWSYQFSLISSRSMSVRQNLSRCSKTLPLHHGSTLSASLHRYRRCSMPLSRR